MPSINLPVSLSINGTRFLDWHDMTIDRSLERMPWLFDMSVRNNWREDGKRRIRRGDAVQVKLGNEVLITGYVDDLIAEFDANQHELRIRGRSKAADLVDCSGVERQFVQKTLAEIIAAVSKPFGINVINESGDTDKFTKDVMTEGETFYEYLEELARMRAVRMADTPTGDVVLLKTITRQSATPLVLGKNVVRARSQKAAQNLFSEYSCYADQTGTGFSASEIATEGHAVDDSVRYRPKVFLLGFDANNEQCRLRAELQKRVNRARATAVTYTVRGWTQNNGESWAPGMLVTVRDEYSGLNENMIVMGTKLIADSDGARTDITVMPKYALDQLPVPKKEDEDELWLT